MHRHRRVGDQPFPGLAFVEVSSRFPAHIAKLGALTSRSDILYVQHMSEVLSGQSCFYRYAGT